MIEVDDLAVVHRECGGQHPLDSARVASLQSQPVLLGLADDFVAHPGAKGAAPNHWFNVSSGVQHRGDHQAEVPALLLWLLGPETRF